MRGQKPEEKLSPAKQIIEINGRAYDAQTGQPLAPSGGKQAIKPSTPASIHKAKSSAGVALDGFVRRPGAKAVRPVQKSRTLMRPAVKKPKRGSVKSEANKTPKAKLPGKNASRLDRAKKVQKSARVSKFGSRLAPKKVVKKSAKLEVVQPAHRTNLQPAVDQLERAMHEATSHLENFAPTTKSSRTKKFAFGSLAAASVIVLGFLAWQMVPSLRVKYAGTKAGFSASLPGYSPAGFGLSDNIESTSGEVALTYGSHADSRSYRIKQSPSNWTSQTLEANYVIPTYGANNYQRYESRGKTIYIKDNSNATWVDGGIWYVLEGNATLTSDQLQRIVNSL